MHIVTKLVVSVLWDAFDFTFGRIPVFGTAVDVFGGILSVMLYGGKGALSFLEVVDFTDQLDGFVPSLTILGLYELFTARRRKT